MGKNRKETELTKMGSPEQSLTSFSISPFFFQTLMWGGGPRVVEITNHSDDKNYKANEYVIFQDH